MKILRYFALALCAATVRAQAPTTVQINAQANSSPYRLTPPSQTIIVPSGGSITADAGGQIVSTSGVASSLPWAGLTAIPSPTFSMTGDGTFAPTLLSSGAATAAFTLASIVSASSVGTSTAIPVITYDAKGRITATATAAVIAPAGTLTGTTLAANVVSSSLTGVGTLTSGATGAGFTVALGTSTVTGVLGVTNGGNGLATATLGDLRYGSGVNTLAALAGNVSATMGVLTQTGNGTVSAAPVWTSTTGTGNVVRATSPALVTPALGVATATSINGLSLTASTGTLTVANLKTLTASNTLTFTGTDGSSVNFGAGGTVLYSGGAYVSSIAGTANQITASASTGAVTLSLPAVITGLTSINGLGIGGTGSSIQFSGSGSSLTDLSGGLTIAAAGTNQGVTTTMTGNGLAIFKTAGLQIGGVGNFFQVAQFLDNTATYGVRVGYDSTDSVGFLSPFGPATGMGLAFLYKNSSATTSEGARISLGGNLLIGGTTDISGSGGLKTFGTTPPTNTTSGSNQFATGIAANGPSFFTTGSFSGAIQTVGGSATAGSMWKSGSTGLVLQAVTGSVYDFAIVNPSNGANILSVPTGTVNAILGGNVTAVGFNGTIGATTPGTGVFTTLQATSTTSLAGSIAGLTAASSNMDLGADARATDMRISMDTAAGQQRLIWAYTAGSTRWKWGVNGTAESGANAGSDWVLQAFSDAGASLGTALSVARSNLVATFGGNVPSTLSTNGTVVISGTGGLGVGGNGFVGGTLNVTGVTTLGASLSNNSAGSYTLGTSSQYWGDVFSSQYSSPGAMTIRTLANGNISLAPNGTGSVTATAQLRAGIYTVSTLPATGQITGAQAVVTDATQAAGTSIGSAPTGSGSVTRLVYYSGASWLLL